VEKKLTGVHPLRHPNRFFGGMNCARRGRGVRWFII
jgi:hypothetical protein